VPNVNLLDQIPSEDLLDFDGLTKNTLIYNPGRLQFLLDAITRELGDFKVNAKTLIC
jgi:hypothetical protein